MIKRLYLGIAGLVFAMALSLAAADAVTGYADITAFELQRRITDPSDTGYVILDVREKSLYDAGHIPGATNIPLKELGYRLFVLDKTKDIIVYCSLGATSKVACQILVNAGFKDVYSLTNGIKSWVYAIETSEGSVSI